MRDLSLKGIARQHLGKTGAVSVLRDVFDAPTGTGAASLRTRLEQLARKRHSFGVSECIYNWTARYEQVWTRVIVRIRLRPDEGIADATMDDLRDTWAEGVATRWSDRWGCGRSGELPCPLTFEVQWVDTGQHHTVRVLATPMQSNMNNWDIDDDRLTAAHEVGHMLGHPDEYEDPACPDRRVDLSTIMGRAGVVPARLMTRFASNIGSSVVGI